MHERGRFKKNGLIEEGEIKPILDKSFSLKDIQAAHKYVESGHKRGGVAITIVNSC